MQLVVDNQQTCFMPFSELQSMTSDKSKVQYTVNVV